VDGRDKRGHDGYSADLLHFLAAKALG
jgi:hypothetical protein